MRVALTSFLLGILSTTNPCILPLYPGFLAYLSATWGSSNGRARAWLGLAALGGVLTMMLALGGLIALLAIPIGRMLVIVVPLANLALVGLGVLLLLDRNPFKQIPQIPLPVLQQPWASAFLYGLLYGPITLPCSGPLLVGIFALSFTMTEAFDKVWVLLWFGLGFGVPLLGLALLSSVFQRRVTAALAQHSRVVQVGGGLLLIGIAIFDLFQNWDMLRLYFL